VRARSAVFDLFGDHLLQRGGWAQVAAIIALNETCGLSAPSTRTALAGLGVRYTSLHGPCPRDPAELAGQVWDLLAVGWAYQAFCASLPDPGTMVRAEPAAAYARRTELVHRWRTFLFLDPALPAEALPPAWPGQTARERFLACAAALAPATQAHVDHVLSETGGSRLVREHTVVPS
jgi:phenylacetic acid degradation operon negative regulatory protein